MILQVWAGIFLITFPSLQVLSKLVKLMIDNSSLNIGNVTRNIVFIILGVVVIRISNTLIVQETSDHD